MSETLHFDEKESEVVFTTKPTNEVLLTYGVTVKTMRIAISVLGTGAGANYVHPSLILSVGNIALGAMIFHDCVPLRDNRSI